MGFIECLVGLLTEKCFGPPEKWVGEIHPEHPTPTFEEQAKPGQRTQSRHRLYKYRVLLIYIWLIITIHFLTTGTEQVLFSAYILQKDFWQKFYGIWRIGFLPSLCFPPKSLEFSGFLASDSYCGTSPNAELIFKGIWGGEGPKVNIMATTLQSKTHI